jgi:hypothetical protein
MLGLAETDERLALVPLLDPELERKLNEADGISKLAVRLPKGATLDHRAQGGGRVQSAISEALDAAEDQLSVEMAFSFGHDRQRSQKRHELLNVAGWLRRSGQAERIDVSLILPDGDGFRVEAHELVHDHVALRAEFPYDTGHQMTTDEILEAIHGTIQQFRNL